MNAPLTILQPTLVQPGAKAQPFSRLTTWLSALFKDHACFRFFFNTRHRVADGLYRSSHPLPYQLRLAAARGIRSVVNLRGCDAAIAANRLEWGACARLGLTVVHVPLRSRNAPRAEELLGLNRTFESLEKPILVHCKSGADRASLASAVYLLTQHDVSVETAARQLSFWRFGHIRRSGAGILDHFLECYARARLRSGIGFEQWLRTEYDRQEIMRSYRENGLAARLVDWILRRE